MQAINDEVAYRTLNMRNFEPSSAAHGEILHLAYVLALSIHIMKILFHVKKTILTTGSNIAL